VGESQGPAKQLSVEAIGESRGPAKATEGQSGNQTWYSRALAALLQLAHVWPWNHHGYFDGPDGSLLALVHALSELERSDVLARYRRERRRQLFGFDRHGDRDVPERGGEMGK